MDTPGWLFYTTHTISGGQKSGTSLARRRGHSMELRKNAGGSEGAFFFVLVAIHTWSLVGLFGQSGSG